MKKEKLYFISIIYTISAIFIALYHSFNYTNNLLMSKVNTITVSCSLSMFFFCGGLLLKYTDGIERKGVKDFISGKVLRLLVPYIVLSTLFFFPKQFLSHESISFYSYSEMIFAPRLNALGHFWFIPVLFNLYFIYAVLSKFKFNHIYIDTVLNTAF